MSSEDDDDKMAALQALDALKEAYGGFMSTAEYNRRKKALLARFSGRLFQGGGAARRRARFSWRDDAGLTNVKGGSFKEVRAKMKGDYKCDPDCRSGELNRFKNNKQCKFVRRLAILDGKERRYRMVLLNNGNFCFQLATDITADDSEDDDDEESDEDEEEEEAPPAPPPPPAAPKNGKRVAAPKKAERRAAEEAGSSTDLPAKRQRKQVQKD